MSPSNIELLAQAFAGWGEDNPANMRDVLHPDCELVVPESVPYGGTFRGAEPRVRLDHWRLLLLGGRRPCERLPS
jgi:ketosteroid isomerase-like protein